VRWLNDPEVVRFSEQRHKTHTLETQHQYLNDFPAGSHIWLIQTLGDSQDFCPDIGTITAYIDQPNRVANMGILIGEKDCWGHGYGREAWESVKNWLTRSEKMRKIEAGMMETNGPMHSLCMGSGMFLDATVPAHFLVDGQPVDLWIYGICP
jgi:RimJ/RimL family protein N-acetyltransferase